MAETERRQELDQLVTSVLATRKYASLLPDFVARVAARDLHDARRSRDALRATRRRLHGSVAAFRGARSYEVLRRELGATRPADREACLERLLAEHASTRERLPVLERFAREVLAPLAGARRVLDLGCGLFPLALPWLPFEAELRYRACDVDLGVVGLVNDFFRLTGVDGEAFAWDLCAGAPDEEADVALLLKAYTSLEQLEPGAGMRVVETVRAPVVVVSFPSASLGGRRRGMGAHHEARFRAQLGSGARQLACSRLPGERVFVLHR